jgi:CRP-like cAMP-binding protein
VDKREILARLGIFSTLEPKEFDRLAELCTTRSLAAREELMHQGDEASRIYGVLSGRL